jgi:hypothetical protein
MPIGVGVVGLCASRDSANAVVASALKGSWITTRSPASAVSTIFIDPSPRATMARSPSGPKVIGSPARSRIWLWALVSLSFSAANAPSLKTLQFW